MSTTRLKRSGSSQSGLSTTSSRASTRASLMDKIENDQIELIPYKITVTSNSNKRRAGISCWLRIFGSNESDTGRILLEYGSDVGGSIGTVENFSVDAPDVGKPKEIELNMVEDTFDEGYFIKDVVISQPTRGKSYVFRLYEEFTRSDSICNQQRRTFPVYSVITTRPKIPFELYVFTGDVSGAGEVMSNVIVKAFGSEGCTEEFELEKVDSRFQRGGLDKIKVELSDVGELRKIRVSIEPGNEWFLEKVEFLNLNTNKRTSFPCSKWFSETQSDGLLTRDLSAVNDKGKPILKTTAYTISVKTSDIRGAGTDANVFCTLFGENGDSGELALKISSTHRDKFERGNIDQFVFPDILSLGHLNKLRIWHDNSGLGASWHLDSVTVYDDKADSTYVFPCKQWLSASEGEKMLCRELVCDSVNWHTSRDTVGYEVSVVTGDKPESETYNHVWLVLSGDEGLSERAWLHNSSKRTLMKRSQTDTIYMPCSYLGVLRYVTIGHFPRDTTIVSEKYTRADQWFCKEVVVKEPTGKKFFFPCNKWITLSEDIREGVKLKQEGYESNGSISIANTPIVQYEITVFTGDLIGAGTDANVFCVLYGESGDTGRRQLTQKFRNLFERGQRDVFCIESQILGRLTKLYIEHDSKGIGPSWYLDRIEVKNMANGEITSFPCQQWISKANGDGIAAIELLPAGIRL